MSKNFRILSLALGLLIACLPAAAVEVTVTIENLAPANGNFLTPFWVGFHDGTFDSYDGGAPLRGSIERIAEDGNTGPLTDEFDTDFGTPQATIPGPNGPIGPGETATMTFQLDASNSAHRYLSYVSMIIPSNDAFVANGAPTAHRVFDLDGNFTPFSFILSSDNGDVNDGGTEVNTEIPAETAFFGQMAPDTGVVENGVVTTHPGFLRPGSGGILDSAMFSGADFITPGYQIARVSVSLNPGTTIRFPLSGDQEVPPVMTDASGVCEGTLNADETRFYLTCNHNVVDPVAAHIHQGPAGENGPVIFDLGDPTSPIDVVWEPSALEVAALLAGNLYVNVHSAETPSGEVRGQIDGCFSGPDSLCLNNDRFKVTGRFATVDGAAGPSQAVELTDDTGYFYFFADTNVEVVVKVLNACADPFNRYWVFAGGLTDVEFELTVEDTTTGDIQVYSNDQGSAFMPIRDTDAFATCP